MTGNQDETRIFLERLFGFHEGIDEQHLLFWSLPDKKSMWVPVSNIDGAVAHIQKIAPTHDTYLQCGLSGIPRGPNERCKAEEVSGIVGLWADIDVQTPYRKKKNLPPTLEEAMKILKGVPYEVSLLVHSGGGVQAWWSFREPWIFKDDDDRRKAMTLTKGWNALLRREAHKLGYVIDSVHDLARVMRPAGTLNHKTDPPTPVKIIADNEDQRYNYEDALDLIPSDINEPTDPESIEVAEFTLDAGATPPFRKFAELTANDRKFKQTWGRTRTDTKNWSDTSASSWDMALATILIANGFTDQEAVDTLIYYREHHGDSAKLRVDYYRRTLQKARATVQSVSDPISSGDEERERIDARVLGLLRKNNTEDEVIIIVRREFPDATGIVESVERMREAFATESRRRERQEAVDRVAQGNAAPDATPETILEGISHRLFGTTEQPDGSMKLNASIDKIIKYTSEPPTYRIVISGQAVQLGGVRNLMRFSYFEEKILDCSKRVVNKVVGDQWRRLVQQMINVIEEQDPGPESTQEGMVMGWIRGYLESRPPVKEDDGDDWQSSVMANAPLIRKDGSLFIPSEGLTRYVRKVVGDRVTPSHLSIVMHQLGGNNRSSLQFRYDGGMRRRRGWTFTNGLLDTL